MTSPSIADTAVSLGGRIGRYFSIVSVLPSLFLVAWTTALVASDSWHTEPDLPLMVHRLGNLNLVSIAWLLLLTTVAALFLHPLQLGMTRLLEGYWGSSPVAVKLLGARIAHYRRRRQRLREREGELTDLFDRRMKILLIQKYFRDVLEKRSDAVHPANFDDELAESSERWMLRSDQGHGLGGLNAALDEVETAKSRYPEPPRMMPTRLGNALRQAEDSIGKQYGLSAIRTAPLLALIAPELDRSYLIDSRQQMDTSIRLCVVALLATLETVACLFTDGWWLLTSLVPYCLAYIAYRAAVAAADDFMTVVRSVLDLNRFKLYESMHIRLPVSTDDERRVNAKLMNLLRGNPENLRYKHPAAGTPSAGDTPPTPPKTP
ncbi:hypothetical protein [Amycolatopsis sp. NPDC051716]|uniref:hypothetical protein n=1 Tax=Amycolatopsis sp. NPDC051716 TaxID=3155804 RepID=UPI00343BA5AE